MWGVTTYFNPAQYVTKRQNLERFARRVRQQGLKLLVIELGFPHTQFAVCREWADTLIQLRTPSILWQKERLLNVAIAQLPSSCDKVVWLDGDILFANDSWVEDTSRLLDQHKIVQPFQIANWLPQGAEAEWETDKTFVANLYKMPGMAYSIGHLPSPATILYRPDLAHPGFAWAARREILDAHGLYDKCILGGGDFFSTLAMYCDSSALKHPAVSRCLSRHQMTDVKNWMDKFHGTVAGDVAATPGAVFHLWHGNLANRRYLERYQILQNFDFDPAADIALDDASCWRWSSDKPEFHSCVAGYFSSRKEDG